MSSKRPIRQALLAAAALLAAGTAQAAPEIQQWTTDNGARVLFVRAPEIPMVDARVTFDAGAARDGGHPGIARMVSNLLMSGTDRLDADALAQAIEREGAEVSTGSARDMAWVEMRSLTGEEHLPEIADTVAAIVARPAFPEAEVARVRDQQLTAIEEQAQSPGSIARDRLWSALYGEHPYAHDPLGSPDSLERIGRAALGDFHGRYYVAANANVAIVGDIDRARAERLAATLVGGLPRGEAAPALPPVPRLEEDVTIREPFPSTQAHVLIGRPAVERGYADWPALYVANHVLGGGGFTSRLFSEVREQRGLVYSIYSYVSPMAASGPFVVGLQTRGDQAEKALSIVREQLAGFAGSGPTAAEVEDAVKNIVGGFPLQVDSNGEISSYLSMMRLLRPAHGLPAPLPRGRAGRPAPTPRARHSARSSASARASP
ncbi:MAG: pitrilysin family protein [Halofilum sp. (in: g-proteobacteria)]|nr:pitrilysin family protein [Halofilum sp. (in: g-proteobacteria)]